MKVYIGPYKSWIGPYQIADWLQYVGVSEERCHKIGEWLNTTWLKTVCEWVEARRQRTVRIKIHDYDTWNMADTLAEIILPMLQQHKQQNHGCSSRVEDEDVPEYLRRTAAPPADESSGHTDALWHYRWQWVLDEMIWAFEQVVDNQEDQFWTKEWHDAFENPDIEEALKVIRKKPEHEVFDRAGYEAYQARIEKGLTLFGKYFRSLWE